MLKPRKRLTKQDELKPLYEGNLYDKIFKENAESIFLPLVEAHLGIKIKSFRHLKEKIQVTLEREMDFFYEVIPEVGNPFILHLEFQSVDEADMVFRHGEYHGINLRRKKMQIRHIVIYLGKDEPKMRTQLTEQEIYRGFELINIHQLNSEELLRSQVPHVIILAILANYNEEQVESVLRLIVRNLKAVCKNAAETSKFLKQLVVLARLRKIENLTLKITEEMPINYDVETDYLYQKGIEKGIEKGKAIQRQKDISIIENLLLESALPAKKIAALVGYTEDFVAEIEARLIKEGKLKSDNKRK